MPLPQENAEEIRELKKRCARLELAVKKLAEILDDNAEVLGYAHATSRVESLLRDESDDDDPP